MKSNFLSFCIVIILLAFSGYSNKLVAQNANNKLRLSNKSKVQSINKKIKKTIRDTLYQSYYKKYQTEKDEYQAYRVKIDSSRGDIRLNYIDANNQFLGPETIIPASKDFIEGDLNNDNCNDLIVSVYHSQNGRPRLDIYCYITQNKQLVFHQMYTGRGLGICKDVSDTSGRFFPSKIVNGELVGQTDCYQNGDPGCCPSLETITYFKFEDGLKFVKQELKKTHR